MKNIIIYNNTRNLHPQQFKLTIQQLLAKNFVRGYKLTPCNIGLICEY